MHLEGLTGCGPKGSISNSVGELIEGQKQLGRDSTTRAAKPQHHLPTADLVGFSEFSVVLLIAAMKLQELNSVFAEAHLIVAKFRQQRLAQMVAVELALLCF